MILWGINNVKDAVDTISLVVGMLAIIWGVRTYTVTKHQFNFSVMISCIERFQNILPDMNSPEKSTRTRAIRRYIDLCNEELFYFKNNYIPDEVKDEWIEGMAFYLPWSGRDGKNINPNALPEIAGDDLLKSYPRVRKAFELNRTYDLESINERMKLVYAVRENIKRDHYQQ